MNDYEVALYALISKYAHRGSAYWAEFWELKKRLDVIWFQKNTVEVGEIIITGLCAGKIFIWDITDDVRRGLYQAFHVSNSFVSVLLPAPRQYQIKFAKEGGRVRNMITNTRPNTRIPVVFGPYSG